MKKTINLDRIYALRREVAYDERMVKAAIEAKSRKRSITALEKATHDIEAAKRYKEHDEKRLAAYEAEAKEAEAMISEGTEIVLASTWLDDYGRYESDTEYIVYKTLEEAKTAYSQLKGFNGGHVEAYIEIRTAGEVQRIAEIRKQMKALKTELGELCGK